MTRELDTQYGQVSMVQLADFAARTVHDWWEKVDVSTVSDSCITEKCSHEIIAETQEMLDGRYEGYGVANRRISWSERGDVE